MIESKILLKLKQLKKQCKMHGLDCKNCIFYIDSKCKIKVAVQNLRKNPEDWDIEKIKEILEK